ncbi:MAG: ABC transporter substrate-binding protein [Clostridiaceae bacterium]|nr:ABC transporter substrate-binding protein [Clostridiaceae bacterium]
MLNIKGKKCSVLIVIITISMLLVSMTGCGNKGIEPQSAPGSDLRGADDASDLTAMGDTKDVADKSNSADSDGQANVTASGNQDEAAGAQRFPRKVTDGNGFEMTIESEPQRILSLNLGADEMLFGMIDKSRIVSLTRYADDEGISNIASEAAGIGARTTMDQVENIIALAPDLILLDTWADAKYLKQLRDAGITVYAFRTPGNIDEQRAVILELAHVVGAEEKGRELVDWMDGKLNAVEERLSALKPEQRLTVMDYGELGSSGLGTNFDDIVTRAGLVNVISEAGIEGWPVISKEKIIEFDPDIIILPSWYYDQKNTFDSMRDALKNDQSLKTVKAIREDRIISVPNPHISAISQYVVLAVEDVARAAYPELFE